MVKKKGKSKRTTLKDKYKIQSRVVEANRKKRKQAKRDAKNGIVKHNKNKDPGIPNSWPFKQDLLKEIQKQRDRQKEQAQEMKDKRRGDLRALKAHQAEGGTARTVEQLIERANQDREDYEAKSPAAVEQEDTKERKQNTIQPGQSSRRAYLRELKKVIDGSDVILQVLDARDPMGSRVAASVENIILSRADKKMVLVLNKIDLVPKEVVVEWLQVLRRSHPTIAIKASKEMSAHQDGIDDTTNTPLGMEGLLQLLKNYARTTDAKAKTAIVVGVVGYPNVGKSSIINALKRCRAVGVSPRPGFTTSMQEVLLDRNVRLLDSPGVVFDDESAMLGNCVDADSIKDPIPAVSALIERCNPASLMMCYNIPSFPPGNVMVFLALVARSYGRVLKGGIPDKVGAARAVLRDWNSGKIPYYTPAPKQVSSAKNDAVIVKSFGTAFDVNKYDDQVLRTLKDNANSDEMDFVQLEETKERDDVDADIFDEVDDDEDDEMEDNDDVAHVSRKELVDAEDYTFTD